MNQPDLDQIAKLLEAEGRALTPPPGALQRVMARASVPQRPHRGFAWWQPMLRPAVAALTVATIVIGLGGGAYASTPGEPLFSVQRALDDAYLALPRTPQGTAQASIGLAERRVAQAANVHAKVSAATLRATLEDAVRYFAHARAAVAAMPDGQRQQVFRALAASELAARDRLVEARDQPEGNNDNVLDEVSTTLNRQGQHDANEGQEGEQGPGSQERKPEQQPGASGTDQKSPGQGSSDQNAKDDGDEGDKSTNPTRP
jgi:hypothetical protein